MDVHMCMHFCLSILNKKYLIWCRHLNKYENKLRRVFLKSGIPFNEATRFVDSRPHTEDRSTFEMGHNSQTTSVILDVRLHFSNWFPYRCTSDFRQRKPGSLIDLVYFLLISLKPTRYVPTYVTYYGNLN